jgi:glycosyltransferase involved in cell wall biosynthesis
MVAKQKLKVLVSAYACEPDKGSEPGVGWNWVKQIAESHEAWVITRANNRESIERSLEESPVPNLHFVYLDLPRWMKFWKRGVRGIHVYYYLWQIAAFFLARRLYRQTPFDLAHQVTFVCDWMPSFLPLLPIPFIWGPIGGQQAPEPLRLHIGWRGRSQDSIKKLVRWFVQRFDPFFMLTLLRSRSIIAVDSGTAMRIPAPLRHKTDVIPACGTCPAELPETQSLSPSPNIVILSIGRFIYCKGFSLTIRAFAGLAQQCPDARLVLVGRGVEYAKLRRLVSENGIEDRVEFRDWVPRAEVLKFMQLADIFLFPSYEGGGMVVLEAMTAGKPVVCLDTGGPGEAVTEECGIKVRIENVDQIVQDLSNALYRLAENPTLRSKMGEAAKRRVHQFYDWDRKGEKIKQIYESVLLRS